MAFVKTTPSISRKAPLNESSLLGWLKVNLFSSVYNSILTILVLIVVFFTVKSVWIWGITDGVWIADTRRECFDTSLNGACWAGIIAWFDGIFYGRYPRDELWRINLGGIILFIWMAPLWLPRVQGKILIALSTVALIPVSRRLSFFWW